jgi:D-beta-D-heptose 7-phosphate kinase/D-beta-D-heptose 1-phosphate adenosyltransferase|tara:strand:- start:507 stop:1568 length:1062 start_codon:yes stop_codon:yes gene_type:complete
MGMSDEEVEVHDQLTNLKRELKAVDNSKVVLIGDVIMDCYIHGYANNLNSRAPVPVLRETMREEDVGAAAHVARGLNSMGLESHLFGVVGDDKSGLNILDALDEEGVKTDGIAIVEGRTTTVKTRLLATRESLVQEEQLLLRWDIEDDDPVPEVAAVALYDRAIEELDNAKVVILSDYGQGVVNDSGADRMIRRALEKNVPIIADPKLTGLHRTHGVDWILFQAQGLELMRRRLGSATGSEAAQRLIEQHNWKHLVVLSGEAGVTIYSAEEETVHAPCTLDDLRQMIGLIDAAAVAIAVAISKSFSVQNTALLANAACECILGAERTEAFSLSREDLVDRIGEMTWNLQISKR